MRAVFGAPKQRAPFSVERDGMFPAFLVEIVIVLVIVGLVLWLLNQIPMDAQVAQILRVVVIVCVVLWLLSVLLNFAGYPLFRR